MGAATSLPDPSSKEPLSCLPYYIITGLSGAGKTTILYRLKLGVHTTCSPSLSENLETIEYEYKDGQVKRVLNLWDLTEGGSRALREFGTWQTHYRQYLRGIIFVVDSVDRDPFIMELASERLSTALQEQTQGNKLLPLLVLANKQDCSHAMTVAEVKDLLRLEELPSEQVWHIRGVSAKVDEGLRDGLDWLLAHSDLHPSGKK